MIPLGSCPFLPDVLSSTYFKSIRERNTFRIWSHEKISHKSIQWALLLTYLFCFPSIIFPCRCQNHTLRRSLCIKLFSSLNARNRNFSDFLGKTLGQNFNVLCHGSLHFTFLQHTRIPGGCDSSWGFPLKTIKIA